MAHSPDPAPLDPDATHTSATPTGKTRVAGYLIERPIASGASGTVYRAIDERLGRRVALKVLSESAFPQARERFLREVRMIAGLQHPNVVLLYGAGEDRGVAWAAIELMPASLSQELHQRGRFSAEDLRAVVRDVCLGLDAVWNRGIVRAAGPRGANAVVRAGVADDRGDSDRPIRGNRYQKSVDGDRAGSTGLRHSGDRIANRVEVRARRGAPGYSSRMNGYV